MLLVILPVIVGSVYVSPCGIVTGSIVWASPLTIMFAVSNVIFLSTPFHTAYNVYVVWLLSTVGWNNEFSPNASANCQAMAAAIFVSLNKLGKLDLLKNPKDFANLFKKSNTSDIETMPECEIFVADDNKSELQPNPVEIKFEVGSVIRHKKWGIGEVLSIEGDNVTVLFIREGEKKLDLFWCKNFCEFIC